jgi:hypothetical protein
MFAHNMIVKLFKNSCSQAVSVCLPAIPLKGSMNQRYMPPLVVPAQAEIQEISLGSLQQLTTNN